MVRLLGISFSTFLLISSCVANSAIAQNSGDIVKSASFQKLQDQPIEAESMFMKPLRRVLAAPERQSKLESQLKRAIENAQADPKSVDMAIWHGRRLAYLWRYNDAIDVYTRAIHSLDSKDARLYRHRGHRYLSIRQFDRALADFEKAAKLIAGTKDVVEPDGQPNAAGIPTSTLHTNIWYHLGLTCYLMGDYERALQAYKHCLAASKNNDMKVATLDWLYMTLGRLNRHEEARQAISGVTSEMKIIENEAYRRRLLMYRGKVSVSDLYDVENSNDLDLATYGYGVANWYLANGDEKRAIQIFKKVVAGKHWSAFGYIASEADLFRLMQSAKSSLTDDK